MMNPTFKIIYDHERAWELSRRKRNYWDLNASENNYLGGFYSHASCAWTWRKIVNKNICLNSIPCRSCWCLRKITSLKSKKGIRKMLIRHAILEMFKYLEPDSNHTPSQIEITRLQNLIANSCCFLCRKFFIKPDYFFTNYFYYLFEYVWHNFF